jgi:hypothetical protein
MVIRLEGPVKLKILRGFDSLEGRAQVIDALDYRGLLKTRAEPGVLQIGLDLIDDCTGGLKRLLGLLPSVSLGLKLTQGKVGLPKLGRIADPLSDR